MLLEREQQVDVIRRLLDSSEGQLARLVVRFRVPAQDAQDLVQDALLAFISHDQPILNPEAWFVATLRNRCFLYWRARRRQLWEAVDATVLEELAGEGEDGTDPAIRHDLGSAIGRLPQRCRSILKLRYGLDRDGPEIAAQLGYRPSSIRQITNRCLAALTAQLVASGYGENGSDEHAAEPTRQR